MDLPTVLIKSLNDYEDKPWEHFSISTTTHNYNNSVIQPSQRQKNIADYFNYGFDAHSWDIYCSNFKEKVKLINNRLSNEEKINYILKENQTEKSYLWSLPITLGGIGDYLKEDEDLNYFEINKREQAFPHIEFNKSTQVFNINLANQEKKHQLSKEEIKYLNDISGELNSFIKKTNSSRENSPKVCLQNNEIEDYRKDLLGEGNFNFGSIQKETQERNEIKNNLSMTSNMKIESDNKNEKENSLIYYNNIEKNSSSIDKNIYLNSSNNGKFPSNSNNSNNILKSINNLNSINTKDILRKKYNDKIAAATKENRKSSSSSVSSSCSRKKINYTKKKDSIKSIKTDTINNQILINSVCLKEKEILEQEKSMNFCLYFFYYLYYCI